MNPRLFAPVAALFFVGCTVVPFRLVEAPNVVLHEGVLNTSDGKARIEIEGETYLGQFKINPGSSSNWRTANGTLSSPGGKILRCEFGIRSDGFGRGMCETVKRKYEVYLASVLHT